MKPLPLPEALRRASFGLPDLAVILCMRSDFIMGIWDDYFPLEEAERQLATAVDWGRYGELFEYDAIEKRLYLPS